MYWVSSIVRAMYVHTPSAPCRRPSPPEASRIRPPGGSSLPTLTPRQGRWRRGCRDFVGLCGIAPVQVPDFLRFGVTSRAYHALNAGIDPQTVASDLLCLTLTCVPKMHL